MKIGIDVDMGGCLISAYMIPSLSSSVAWAKNEKCEMCKWFPVICPLWSGVRIWFFLFARVLCNITRKVVQHLIHMNVEMKHEVSLKYLYFLSNLNWPPGHVQGYWLPCPVYLPCAWLLRMWPWYESSCSRGWSISGTHQGWIIFRPLIELMCGRCRRLRYPWSVETDWLSRCRWWSASWGGHGFTPWDWPSCCHGCPS